MIMFRNAEDEHVALGIANGMESAGATVIAITPDGEATHPGALAPHMRLVVWARITDGSQIDHVDEAIARERGFDEDDEETEDS